jgi:hypothetical protein
MKQNGRPTTPKQLVNREHFQLIKKGKADMPSGESRVYRILVADDEAPNLKLFQDIVYSEFDDFTENGKN